MAAIQLPDRSTTCGLIGPTSALFWRQEDSRLPTVLQLEEYRSMSLTTLTPAIVIAIVAVILAIGVALWMYVKYGQKKRTQELRSKFGPEYDKAIGEHRDRGHAELELLKREKRVAKFHIHPLK